MGGTDDESNIQVLTIPEHAEAHRLLYETYGKTEDKIAWKMLLSNAEDPDLYKELLSFAGKKSAEKRKKTGPWNKGKTGVYSHETLEKMSRANRGKRAWNKGVSNPLSAENGRKGAAKLAATATGRKRVYHDDGTWTWGR